MRKYARSTLAQTLTVAFLAAALNLSGCSHLRFPAAFKIDVAQGNILDIEKVEQLQPGMTRRQVVYLLGSPVLKNSLTPDLWHYVYQFSHEGDIPKKYQVSLQFKQDVLESIDGDVSLIRAWHEDKKSS